MTPERFQRLKQILAKRQTGLTVLMEDVHKPRNFAAIQRSCDAVGVQEIHAIAPEGLPRRRPKASAGSRIWVSTIRHNSTTEAAETLHQRGFKLIAAHPSEAAIDYREFDYTQACTLVLGSELVGLKPETLTLVDATVSIPMMGMVQSLNVSVSAALILYEAQRQRQIKGMYEQCQLEPADYRRLLFEWAWPRLARYCRKHGYPYPEFDLNTGEVLSEIPRGPNSGKHL